MSVLVTGAAGFVGSHVAHYLLERGERVIGIDNLNSYYDVVLKHARIARLGPHKWFSFLPVDVTDEASLTSVVERHPDIDTVIHLAAQAGVRYSLTNPLSYVDSNVKGQVVLLEVARKLRMLKSLIYASSSSVYGYNEKQPFSVGDPVDHPASLYAATKRASELITDAYARIYGLYCVGLRFFTIYGPWGRPDMAYYLFTEAILAGRPIQVFNEGRMQRDFTYIDDILPAISAAANPPSHCCGQHVLYNLGNNRPVSLLDFITVLEGVLGRKALKIMTSMQPGDVIATYADIEPARRDLGFDPKTTIADGLRHFVTWHREYIKQQASLT